MNNYLFTTSIKQRIEDLGKVANHITTIGDELKILKTTDIRLYETKSQREHRIIIVTMTLNRMISIYRKIHKSIEI